MLPRVDRASQRYPPAFVWFRKDHRTGSEDPETPMSLMWGLVYTAVMNFCYKQLAQGFKFRARTIQRSSIQFFVQSFNHSWRASRLRTTGHRHRDFLCAYAWGRREGAGWSVFDGRFSLC